jgi:4-hydroxybenzoate polyprenyltransferase
VSALRHYYALSRPFTLLAPAVGMVSGSLVALKSTLRPAVGDGVPASLLGSPTGWREVVLGAVLAALLNASSNAVNQIFDLAIDRVNKPERPLPSGALTLRQAWGFTVVTAILAFAVAAVLPWPSLPIVAFTGFLVYSYSGPPLRTKRFWWAANPTIAIPRGTLLFIAGWSAVNGGAGLDNPFPWILGGMYGLFVLGAATTKDYADIPGDRAEGCITLPIRFGVRRSIWITAPFLVLPWLVLPAGVLAHGLRTPRSLGLAALGVGLALWGAHVLRLLLKDPEALTRSSTHPSWQHMYLMMVGSQVGVAACFWLLPS